MAPTTSKMKETQANQVINNQTKMNVQMKSTTCEKNMDKSFLPYPI